VNDHCLLSGEDHEPAVIQAESWNLIAAHLILNDQYIVQLQVQGAAKHRRSSNPRPRAAVAFQVSPESQMSKRLHFSKSVMHDPFD